jgi:hypothetical protein
MSTETDDEKIKLEKRKHQRDEQFWFTATTLTFNGFLMTKAEIPSSYSVVASLVVSLYAVHLILNRWLAAADLMPKPPSGHLKSLNTIWKKTWNELSAECLYLPFALCELSGGFFYVVFIVISFIGVALHAASTSCR